MLGDPSDETIAAFGNANRHLYEVRDAYRIGAKLKIQYKAEHPPEIRFPPMTRVFKSFP
jgi:hypothetical protein